MLFPNVHLALFGTFGNLEHLSSVLSRAFQKCINIDTLINRKIWKMPSNVVVMVSFHIVNSETEHDTEVLSLPNGMLLSLASKCNKMFKFICLCAKWWPLFPWDYMQLIDLLLQIVCTNLTYCLLKNLVFTGLISHK